MGAFTQYAIAASDEALNDSGLEISDDNAITSAFILASGIGDSGALARASEAAERGAESDLFLLSSSQCWQTLPRQVSIRHRAKGPNLVRRRRVLPVITRWRFVQYDSAARR